MRFFDAFASLVGLASLTGFAAADLRITADHFSFGGVNYPGLQTLNAAERDEVIQKIVNSGARVVRLFSMFPTAKNTELYMLTVFSPSIWRLSRRKRSS
jgi:hypothetical protein